MIFIKHIRKVISSMDDMRRNTLLFAMEGIFGTILINLINPFISMYAKRLGAGDFHIGLLSSLPALVGILALVPGAIIVDQQKDKKKIVEILILLYGILYPFAALAPYLGYFSVPVYIIIISLVNWPFSVFNISWQSFFSDVFSSGTSNVPYTLRTKLSTLFGVITALLAGLVLAYLPKSDEQRVFIYQIFFIAAFFFAILQLWFLSRVKGYRIPEKAVSSSSVTETVKKCLKNLKYDKPFKSFILVAFLFHVSWHMGWPLFFIYHVDYLHANEAWLSYISVVSGIANVLTFSYWSRKIEKKGARMVIIVGGIGLALNAALTIASSSLYMVLMVNIVNGLTFPAFQLALFEDLMEVVPKENKTLNIAIYTTFINLSNFASPLVGVWIYEHTSIYFAMTLIAALRIGATVLFFIRYKRSKNDCKAVESDGLIQK